MSEDAKIPPPGSSLDPKKDEPLGSKPPEFIDKAFWFLRNPLFLGILVVLYVILRLTGHDLLCPILKEAGVECEVLRTNLVTLIQTNTVTLTNVVPMDVSDSKTLECIAYARMHNKPYWIESITEIVHLQFDKKAMTRTAHFQVVYVLRLLRDVNPYDRSFTEWFNSSDQRAKLTRTSGSDEESVHGANSKFDVEISGKAGEVRTVVTGGIYVWPYDADPRSGLGNILALGKNDDTWNYPNDSDDAIREYTMLLYSEGEEIEPVGRSAILLKDGKLDTASARFARPEPASGPALPSISARWENIFGGQEVAIHYSWSNP